MIGDLFTLREREIFNALNRISGCEFVVIGGYAVNAYTLPRFSVDCDIVVKDSLELKRISDALLREGYSIVRADAQYSGSFKRLEKKLEGGIAVSMDILVGGVTDRMTGAEFEADWVFKNSGVQTLKGKTIAGGVKARIIWIDALLAMKITSCRATDIRDVFMMLPNSNDPKWVKSEVAARCSLRERAEKLVDEVSSKQFRDGLSGVYGYFDESTFEKHKKAALKLMKE